MSETVKNGVGGEDLSDAEKIVPELGDFVKKAKEHKDYEEWREYSVPVKLGIDVEPILKTLKKNAYDFELDTTNSKYDDYLDGLLGIDVDREDFYDPITGDENDDAYSDARYESRLQKIDAMGEDESINDEYLANGINRFTVEYHVDGGENRGDETLSYTRDMLDRKSMPYSMTTGLAELLMERIDDNKSGVETLAEMSSFEEHMAEKEKNRETEKSYEDVAIHSIAEKLGIDENRFKEAVSEGGDDEILGEAAARVREQFNEEFTTDYDSMDNKEYFVLNVLSDIHDKWCKDNEAAFFDPEQYFNRYRFLDLSMIGFDNVTAYLKFAAPILEKIGVEINDENLREQYKDYPLSIDSDGDRMLDALHGWYFDDLEKIGLEQIEGEDGGGAYYFAEGLHRRPSLFLSHGASEKIRKTIEEDFETAADITIVLAKIRGTSTRVENGSLWAYHKRGGEGLDDYYGGIYDPFKKPRSDEDDDGSDDPYFTSQEYINDGWD